LPPDNAPAQPHRRPLPEASRELPRTCLQSVLWRYQWCPSVAPRELPPKAQSPVWAAAEEADLLAQMQTLVAGSSSQAAHQLVPSRYPAAVTSGGASKLMASHLSLAPFLV